MTLSGHVKQDPPQLDSTPETLEKKPSSLIRWLGITARTGHIGVSGVLFGGLVLAVPAGELPLWHHLTIASGCVLLLLEWLHDSRWLHRGKGLLGLLHIGLGLLVHLRPDLTVPLLCGILVSGCLGSHMPRRFRHWSILHGWEIIEKAERRK